MMMAVANTPTTRLNQNTTFATSNARVAASRDGHIDIDFFVGALIGGAFVVAIVGGAVIIFLVRKIQRSQ
jgi:hypothetical protein